MFDANHCFSLTGLHVTQNYLHYPYLEAARLGRALPGPGAGLSAARASTHRDQPRRYTPHCSSATTTMQLLQLRAVETRQTE